jgi:hypothetical protein
MASPAYQISRNGQPVGTFDLQQVQQMYSSGLLQPSDFAWTPGMPDWQPLATLLPGVPPPTFPGARPHSAPQASPQAPNGCLALVVPIGRSGWAIAAGYLGLLSLLVLPAPFAILCGVMAIKDIRRNPEKLGLVRAWFGILSGAAVLCLLLVGIIMSVSKR